MTDEAPKSSLLKARELPATISLRWCNRCFRTDRFVNLKDRHFAFGHLCEGTVYVATYRLDKR